VSVRIVAGAVTDVGRVRDHNEDGYLLEDDLGLFALADGMGGHLGGEVASATALDALRSAFTERHDLRDAVVAANDAVYAKSAGDDNLRGMGTTLTAGVLGDDGETLIIGHVGDSRAYLLRDGALRRVTTDHSLVEELIQAGELTEEEAMRDPRRSMITRAIGLERGVEVDLFPIVLIRGDRFLICSDGLTDMVSEADLADVLVNDPDPTSAAQHLVDAANAAGGVDNITVVIADVISDDTPVEAVEVDADDDDTIAAAPVTDDERDDDVGDEGDDEDDDQAAPKGRRRFGIIGRRRG
jgi:serine/threonine protein phosphatase PrpC